MVLGITKKTVVGFLNLMLITGLSATAYAENKEIVSGDITESKVTTVIAKAPTDLGFKALDTDANGKISLKEAIKDRVLASQFNATDVNHDDAITADEYALYTSTTKKPTAVN